MGMVSSETLASQIGVSHKQVKSLILKYNVRAIPSGSSTMDAGKPQRMVLVDEDAFHQGLAENASVNSRGSRKTAVKKNGSK